MNIKKYSVLKLERMVHVYKFIFHQMGQTKKKIICYFISVLRKLYLAKRAVCVFIAYPGLYNWITLKHVSFI